MATTKTRNLFRAMSNAEVDTAKVTFPFPVWWWVSFVDRLGPTPRLLGVAIVPSDRMDGAVARAKLLGLYPGGDATGWVLACPPPSKHRNRLLSEKEAISLDNWVCARRDDAVLVFEFIANHGWS